MIGRRLLIPLLALAVTAAGDTLRLREGDRVALIGDSITEQRTYTRYLENYLLACSGLKDLRVCVFGNNGETASAYVWRMPFNQEFWPATVATTLYGMNDGGHQTCTPQIAARFRNGNEQIAQFMQAHGVRLFAASPTGVDPDTYGRGRDRAAVYNRAFDDLGAITREVVEQHGGSFVDLHPLMMQVMTDAKARYGAGYHVCGKDGIHPWENGQLVIAYAFLKAFGCDGAIGDIVLDYATGKAEASAGHRVLESAPGQVRLESSRYPFCFDPPVNDRPTPDRNATILPFLPFNQELNRFRLIVKNLPTARAEVQYGKERQSFTREQLAQGINLAEAFPGGGPFRNAWNLLHQATWQKQAVETWAIKDFVRKFHQLIPDLEQNPEAKRAYQELGRYVRAELDRQEEEVRKALQPVTYRITVTPLAE